jgi:hypothetical protein
MEEFTEREKLIRKKAFIAGSLLGIALSAIVGVSTYFVKKSDRYSLDNAAGIVVDLFKETDLKTAAKDYGIGGDFPVKIFRDIHDQCNSKDSCGIALWFCFDKANKQLFVAAEATPQQYDYKRMPKYPAGKTYRPVRIFPYPWTDYDDAALKSYIKYEVNKPLLGQAVEISDSLVRIYIDDFRTAFGKHSQYSFSFFAENAKNELDHCISQAEPNGFIRYYFGYQAQHPQSRRAMPNKIRVVLVAADQDGDNVVDGSARAVDPIVQSSWPPPPWN